MHASGGLAAEAVAAIYVAEIHCAICPQPYLRADRAAVGFSSFQQKSHPMGAGGKNIAIEVGLVIGIGDKQIKAAIIVKIGHRNAASISSRIQSVACCLILERVAVLVVKQPLLFVAAERFIANGRPV